MKGCGILRDSNGHQEDEESGCTEGINSNYIELDGEKDYKVNSSRN